MKNKLLKTAILAAATTALSANAYDSGELRTGGSGVELHFIGFDIEKFSSGSAVGVENQLVLKVHNRTGDFAAGAPAPVADTYEETDADPSVLVGFDASFNPIFVTQDLVIIGLAFSYAPNALGPTVPFTFENGTGDEPTEYHLETSLTGKMQPESYWRTNTVATAPNTTFFDIKTRGFLNLINCTTDPSIYTDLAAVRAYMTGPVPAAPVIADPFPGSGCELTGLGTMHYFTCDIGNECGQFEKSVPIPAFAAGILALGLAGITYTTSRRRSIK